MNIYAGNNQNAAVNTAFATPLAVQLVDTYGNPVIANWGVTYMVEAGSSGASGTFGGAAAVSTNSSGVATAPALTANGTTGAFSVFAYSIVGGAFLYQTFTLTNVATLPPAITAIGGTPQTATLGAAFATALSAKVTGSGGNPTPGVTVTFAAPTSGASATLSSSTATTNSSGIASVTATANAVAGSYTVTASTGQLSTLFALNNVANKCDINLDTKVNVGDVQLEINEALGLATAVNDLNGDGTVNVVDVQIVIDAALSLGCAAK